ncbi:hypothetical protein BESB_043370 [Besnoitia besnoiti]|uniref:Uncharacterized protein n=1 Tax=Besnoitia besnoiti TaxID=94643 RepID=A0A2A9MDS2_BESBE|nr:hypothetical protein BESB_043370 [Besnoitia besnoiti]PFH36145.1 hypothetical protein BESB_043370 [Besnoitia besnoiti]
MIPPTNAPQCFSTMYQASDSSQYFPTLSHPLRSVPAYASSRPDGHVTLALERRLAGQRDAGAPSSVGVQWDPRRQASCGSPITRRERSGHAAPDLERPQRLPVPHVSKAETGQAVDVCLRSRSAQPRARSAQLRHLRARSVSKPSSTHTEARCLSEREQPCGRGVFASSALFPAPDCSVTGTSECGEKSKPNACGGDLSNRSREARPSTVALSPAPPLRKATSMASHHSDKEDMKLQISGAPATRLHIPFKRHGSDVSSSAAQDDGARLWPGSRNSFADAEGVQDQKPLLLSAVAPSLPAPDDSTASKAATGLCVEERWLAAPGETRLDRKPQITAYSRWAASVQKHIERVSKGRGTKDLSAVEDGRRRAGTAAQCKGAANSEGSPTTPGGAQTNRSQCHSSSSVGPDDASHADASTSSRVSDVALSADRVRTGNGRNCHAMTRRPSGLPDDSSACAPSLRRPADPHGLHRRPTEMAPLRTEDARLRQERRLLSRAQSAVSCVQNTKRELSASRSASSVAKGTSESLIWERGLRVGVEEQGGCAVRQNSSAAHLLGRLSRTASCPRPPKAAMMLRCQPDRGDAARHTDARSEGNTAHSRREVSGQRAAGC